MYREEIFGYVQEAERYFLYYDTLLYNMNVRMLPINKFDV